MAGASTTHSVSVTFTLYNEKGQVIGARGESTTDNTTKTLTVKAGEVARESSQTNHSHTVSDYIVVGGQAVVSRSKTTSTMVNGNVTTESTSYMNYHYNALGQLDSATGSSSGTNKTRVHSEPDNDPATIDPPEWSDQISDFSSTNVYGIIWGQAQLLESTTTSGSATGTSESETTSHVAYRYDSQGRLVSATGTSHTTSTNDVFNDANGNKQKDAGEVVKQQTTSDAVNTYAIHWGQAVVTQSVTDQTTRTGMINNDPATATTVTTSKAYMFYTYNDLGQLTGVTGYSDGNVHQQHINKVPRVVSTTSFDSEGFSAYLSTCISEALSTATDLWMVGGASQALARGLSKAAANLNAFYTTTSSVVYDNVVTYTDTPQHTENTFDIINGQAVMVRTTTHSTAPAGATNSTSDATTSYTYDYNSGALLHVTGDNDSHSTTTFADGTTSTTTSHTANEFLVRQGQALLMSATTTSTTDGPGNHSTGTTTTRYTYDERGMMIGARGTTSSDTTTQVYTNGVLENQTNHTTGTNTYVVLWGQAMLLENISHSENNFKNVNTVTDSVVRYSYNAQGQMIGAIGFNDATTTTTNADGSKTYTSNHVDNDYAVYFGQAQIAASIGRTSSHSGDLTAGESAAIAPVIGKSPLGRQNGVVDTGATSWTVYQYNALGQITGALGGSKSITQTLNKDTTISVSVANTRNDYIVVGGQALVTQSRTHSTAYSGFDRNTAGWNLLSASSITVSDTIMTNTYDAVGRLTGAGAQIINGVTTTTNSDGTRSISHFHGTNQYAIIGGQAVVINAQSDSTTVSGATTTTSHSNTDYTYNSLGQLVSATGTSTGSSDTTNIEKSIDANGNATYSTSVTHTTMTSEMTYRVVAGQALVTKITTTSHTTGADSTSDTTSDTFNEYDARGLLVSSYSTSTTDSVTKIWDRDLNGNKVFDANEEGQQTAHITSRTQNVIVWGQAVASRTTSHTHSATEGNINVTDSDSDVSYTYNARGQLTGAVAQPTTGSTTILNADGSTTVTRFTTTNVYEVRQGQALVSRSSTHSTTTADRTTTTTDSVTSYQYNALGQLTGANSSADSTSITQVPDSRYVSMERRDISHTDTTMAIHNGQAVAGKSVTTSDSYSGYSGSNYLAAVSHTHNTSWTVNDYNGRGQLIRTTGGSEGYSDKKNSDNTVTHSVLSGDNTYVIIGGQSVVSASHSLSTTYSAYDGTNYNTARDISTNESNTGYALDRYGRVTGGGTTFSSRQATVDSDGRSWTYSFTNGWTTLIAVGGQTYEKHTESTTTHSNSTGSTT
ncbi:MAG TPA: hypothetical protein PKD69_01495, partial [Elusimicrobiota bacterium]|nr:hypothetical protein [Elusimicrobiota bacterium]